MLSPENIKALMSQSVPMPVARTASLEEAEQPEAEVTETPAKDEALREVYSPPGRHQHPLARAKTPAKRAQRPKRKRRAK